MRKNAQKEIIMEELLQEEQHNKEQQSEQPIKIWISTPEDHNTIIISVIASAVIIFLGF